MIDDKLERKKEIFKSSVINNSNKMLRRIDALSGKPESIEPFIDVLKRTFVDLRDVKRPRKFKETFGVFCVMVPEEMIYAANAIPVKLCSGIFSGAQVGEDFTPRDACPLVKASIGVTSMDAIPIYKNCSKFIVPTSCDCKKKMAYDISKFKPVIPIHVPSSRYDDTFVNNFVKDLYKFKNTLEYITRNQINYNSLKESFRMIARAQIETYKLIEMQKRIPAVIKGSHVITVMNAYAYEHVNGWTDDLCILNKELEDKVKYNEFVARENSPRILFAGSPVVFPNLKIPVLIEESGGILAADETCLGTRRLYDPVAITDDSLSGLMRALAVRYLMPCTCPTFVQNKQRLFRIKQMVDDHKIDGIIYHVLRGCQVYDFEYNLVEDEMKKYDIPVLRVETDYNEEDIEQLRIRLEAFIEMIKYKEI
ncbi:MAG: 2-hydroxyacyl-CoA dehydratase family protein [Clostridiales bacterium]